MIFKSLAVLAIMALMPTHALALHVFNIPTKLNIDNSKVTAIVGPIDEAMAASVELQLMSNKDLPGDRLVLIESPGGSVQAAATIIKLLEAEKLRGFKLVCVAVGFAHSAAFNILSHCDVRYATVGAEMLVHKIAIGGANERLTAKNLRKIAAEIDAMNKSIDLYNANKMHLTLAEYNKKADAETTWSALELVKLGYLEDIVTIAP